MKLTLENIASWARECGVDKEPRTTTKEEITKTYKILLGLIEGARKSDARHLSDSDRRDIQSAMHSVVTSYHLAIQSNDPETLRTAIGLAMEGALFVGMRCVVSVSAKKYWNIRHQGRGGDITGKSKQADAAIWQKWVLGEISSKNAKGEWIKIAALRIADKLKERKQLPVILPDRDRVARFISKARKANTVSGRRKAIRLVHG
jgi:hypothetical protein